MRMGTPFFTQTTPDIATFVQNPGQDNALEIMECMLVELAQLSTHLYSSPFSTKFFYKIFLEIYTFPVQREYLF